MTTKRIDDATFLKIAKFTPRISTDGGVEYAHTFNLENSKDSDIIIEDIGKSCSCLNANISKEIIHPGDHADVSLSVKSSTDVYKQGTLTLSTNQGDRYVFRIETWTFPTVMIDGNIANKPISLGGITPGITTNFSRKITLYSNSKNDWPQIKWSRVEGQPFECSLNELRVEPVPNSLIWKKHYLLNIMLNAGTVQGLKRDEISFQLINSEGETGTDSIEIPVVWNIIEVAKLNPVRWLYRRNGKKTKSILKSFVAIERVNDFDISIAKIECTHDALMARQVKTTNPSLFQLEITLDLSKVPLNSIFSERVNLDLTFEDHQGKNTKSSTKFPVIVID
ncbi:DUF1573 domain-containing protein [Gimesia sp.]|uniref:DUF1573 domain-containing protein n=1 Tax=Gimesia sp. TaxID=2024833 RepID=UPI003A936E38